MSGRLMNCPNCGAPITGARCEYCGTVFLDFGALSMDEPTYIRLRTGKDYVLFRGIISHCEMEIRHDNQYIRAMDGTAVYVNTTPQYRLSFEAVGAPNEKGVVIFESEKPAVDIYDQDAAAIEMRAEI